MLTKSQIANGVLAATLVYDLYVARKKREKYNEILELNMLLQDQLHRTQHAANYLGQKLANNEIDLTPFDWIVISNPM